MSCVGNIIRQAKKEFAEQLTKDTKTNSKKKVHQQQQAR